MAKTQKFLVRNRGNKSFYGSELFRKVLQTLRGKYLTEASVLRGRPELILSLHCHTTDNEWLIQCPCFLSIFVFLFELCQHPDWLHPSFLECTFPCKTMFRKINWSSEKVWKKCIRFLLWCKINVIPSFAPVCEEGENKRETMWSNVSAYL